MGASDQEREQCRPSLFVSANENTQRGRIVLINLNFVSPNIIVSTSFPSIRFLPNARHGHSRAGRLLCF